MKQPTDLFSWLFDLILDAQAIRFVLFGVWKCHSLSVENIKSVAEVGAKSKDAQNLDTSRQHKRARSFLIKTKLGWWWDRKMFITPRDPDAFVNWLKLKKIDLQAR
ncbi:hypothetical protein ACO0LM_02125 [Undibacterium sp. Di26W]|uniref:hypothetical protein n=1 Tax=Undibacterium sp. Di26W TaxID=3413035 RepID=UPI003BF00659